MGFNTEFDPTLPPFNGQHVIMDLNHVEVMHVKTETGKIIAAYKPQFGEPETPPDTYIVPEYNKLDWTKAINGATWFAIDAYDPEVNTLGINAAGIIQPEPEVVDEPVVDEPNNEPMDQEPTPVPVEEGTQPVAGEE